MCCIIQQSDKNSAEYSRTKDLYYAAKEILLGIQVAFPQTPFIGNTIHSNKYNAYIQLL